ncbi:MAG: D-alanyl-D-alanine carboxypeptidase [Clostridia bacterium]|nr:D-alanyl-D-alanine carboxypeptidase [Clostridia bacterium]
MSADTGEIFDRKNEHLRLPMASTTKTMTALVILENCLPDEIVEIDQTAVRVEGSSIYLKRGEKFTVKELLFGLMLRSGNDAAVALAIHCAGSIESFAGMMNLKAEELGLIDTHFVNPHGLHDPEHYTSAYDLCKIGCEAMKNPMFREIVNTKFVTVGEGENKRYWSNKNKILTTFDGGNGIKTGFTKNAGRCLIASATREGKTVVSVVLNRYDMFSECRTMMEDAFSVIKSREKAVG